MKFKALIFFLFVMTTAKVTLAEPNSSSQQVQQKDRVEIFKKTLSYIPSLMLSVMDQIELSHIEKIVFSHIANIAVGNMNLTDVQEYVMPRKYVNFDVHGTSDQRYFKELKPGLPVRMASTIQGELKAPILINTLIANNPNIEITLPDAVQLLIHEIAWKIPGINESGMAVADIIGAKVKKALQQNYQVIDLSSSEKLHLLNSPMRKEPPFIGADPKQEGYEKNQNSFKSQYVRMGREILIFYEDVKGFVYVPTLKHALLDGLRSMKTIEKEGVTKLAASINIEQIHVDRAVNKRPFVRFMMSVQERAYRSVDETAGEKDGEAIKTGNKAVHSFSALAGQGIEVDEGDETLKTKLEIGLEFQPDKEVEISRREVLPSEPTIQIKDLKWQDQDLSRFGSFTIDIPQDKVQSLITNDLRAYLWARMESGLARIEVMRLVPEGNKIKIDFKIPSSFGATQAYTIEEVIIKNKNKEYVLDLPETLIIKNPQAQRQQFELKSLERATAEGTWAKLPIEIRNEQNGGGEQTIDKMKDIPGLINVTPGNQKFRMLFKSQAPLHEIYFYFRSMYLTHDPMARKALGQLFDMPLLGGLLAKQAEGIAYQSASHYQIMDQVIHLSGSQIKQVQQGADLLIEFEIPMNVMPDKGPNTFDTGLRYVGKIIAVNQRLERWRVNDLRHPTFSVEGTHHGAKSCSGYFKKKN